MSTPSTGVPEAAVEAMRNSLIAEGWDDAMPDEIARRAHISLDQGLASVNEDLHDALAVAYPAILTSLEEKLLSGGTIKAAGAESSAQHHFRPHDHITKTLLKAAFSKATEGHQ